MNGTSLSVVNRRVDAAQYRLVIPDQHQLERQLKRESPCA
jgi:hypothetical protein